MTRISRLAPLMGLALASFLWLASAGLRASQVTLAWNASPSPDITNYCIVYGTQSGVYTSAVDVGTALTNTVTGLTNGVTYYFAVVADNGAGMRSLPSNQVSYTVPQLLQVGVGSTTGLSDSTVLVPITVTGFTNIAAAQCSVQWDPTVAQYVGLAQFGLTSLTAGNFGTNQAANGTITFSWDDPAGQGITLPDQTELFALVLKLVGPKGTSTSVTVAGTPTPMLAVNGQLAHFEVAPSPGQINIQDTTDISGQVTYAGTDLPLAGVTLNLSGGASQSLTTDSQGAYDFPVTPGADYAVTPSVPVDQAPAQGITTLDIALVREQILGTRSLASPYQVIAADVDGSGQVNTLDILWMRRMILAMTNSFPGGQLWQFVPANEVFSDPLNPWPFQTSLSYSALSADQMGQDFVAIKLGDVNGSWTAPAAGLLRANPGSTDTIVAKTRAKTYQSGVTFTVASGSVAPDGTVTLPVSVSGFNGVTTVQFTLAWDTNALALVKTSGYGLASLAGGNFNSGLASHGQLPFSWDDPTGQGVTVPDGTRLFDVQFQALAAARGATSVALSDTPTPRQVSVADTVVVFNSQSGLVQLGGAGTPSFALTHLVHTRNGFGVSFSTQVGKSYYVEFTDSLSTPKWQVAAGPLNGTGQVVSWTDDGTQTGSLPTGSSMRFYRIRSSQ